MPAITISRSLGSLGSQIARDVARHLNYRLVGRQVINEAACRACAPEVALAVIDELELLGLRPSAKAYRAYLEGVEQVLTELAVAGEVVIIGRAGQVILRDRTDILHIRVVAPKPLRVERLAERQRISTTAAAAQIAKSDTTRYTYLKRNYRIDWDDPRLYDLIINTEGTAPPTATALISLAWKHRLGGVERSVS